jgi:pantoate--beta-alanine ligase
MSTSSSPIPSSTIIPTISTLPDLRAWRNRAFKESKTVGIVPTMGALHDGHLNLGMSRAWLLIYTHRRSHANPSSPLRFTLSPVRHSLRANPLTVLTLFINPTQFAPHEDLSSYPRTLANDLKLLEGLLHSEYPTEGKEDRLIVFAPGRETMYPLSTIPSGTVATGERMLQDTTKQRGTFVEVKGWGDVLEGASRRESSTYSL